MDPHRQELSKLLVFLSDFSWGSGVIRWMELLLRKRGRGSGAGEWGGLEEEMVFMLLGARPAHEGLLLKPQTARQTSKGVR